MRSLSDTAPDAARHHIAVSRAQIKDTLHRGSHFTAMLPVLDSLAGARDVFPDAAQDAGVHKQGVS